MPKDCRQLLARAAVVSGFALLFTVQTALAAGTGTLKGRVFDKQTKEALPGATVLVKGTVIGASTDLNGAFVIHGVPAGEQTIAITYVGYRSSDEKVQMPENGTVTEDFYLTATAVQGKVVVVTAQAEGQMQAINQQLSSNKIVDIVSSAKIQSLPDFNAAQAISRLPGISVLQSSGEADKVVIRGLAPQYNEIAVAGITLASTGSTQIGAASQGGTAGSISDDRSVNLTMVSPYMIKTIQVYKSLTPDMEANAIGGYVNMDLREAPSGLHGEALWQSGYTQKSNTYGNYRAVASASDRFFNDKLGVYVFGNAEQYDRSADNMNASYTNYSSLIDTTTGYRPVQVNTVTLDRHIETRKRYGANLILDYRLPNGSITSINMFSQLVSNYSDYKEGLDYRGNGINYSYAQGNTTNNVGVNSVRIKNDFGFMSADITGAFTYSTNTLPPSPYYQFRQSGGVVTNPLYNINKIPDSLATHVTGFVPNQTLLTSLSLLSSTYKEYDQLVKADFKVPLNVGRSISGYIKFGGEFRHNNHTNNQHTPYASLQTGSPIQDSIQAGIERQPWASAVQWDSLGRVLAGQFESTDSKLYNSFLGNEFGKMYYVINPTALNEALTYIRNNPSLNAVNSSGTNAGGWFDSDFQRLPNNYMYIENYSAAYLMSELDLGPDFMAVGGVRYEQVTSSFTAFNLRDSRNPATQPSYVDTVTVHPGNKFLLPMVQAKYDFASWGDIRSSYTQTVARPAYSELSPHYNIGYGGGPVWSGNPDLKTARAYNYDLHMDIHDNTLGLFSIGAFYKEIKDFSYATSYILEQSVDPITGLHYIIPPGLDSLGSFSSLHSPPTPGTTLYTYVNNRYKAYVRGVEVALQTRLWYLPSPLNGVVLSFNYTHMSSSTRYPLIYPVTTGIGLNRKTTIIDSTRAGRFIYQPNDIMNAAIGYDYEGFSARLSFVFQGNALSSVGSYPESDGYTKNYFRIDFEARQMLPWSGLELYVDGNNLNSESNISVQNSIGGFTSEEYYGLTADIGLRLML